MHRFVVMFVGCLGVAWLAGGFDCAVVFVVLGDAGPFLLSPCNTRTRVTGSSAVPTAHPAQPAHPAYAAHTSHNFDAVHTAHAANAAHAAQSAHAAHTAHEAHRTLGPVSEHPRSTCGMWGARLPKETFRRDTCTVQTGDSGNGAGVGVRGVVTTLERGEFTTSVGSGVRSGGD